jgi:hypothetical protein
MSFEELGIRLRELYDIEIYTDNSQNENYKPVKAEFNEVFLNLVKASMSEKKFFSGSPLNLFEIILKDDIENNEQAEFDFDEIEYIKKIYLRQCNLLSSRSDFSKNELYYYISYLNVENKNLFRSIINKRINFLEKLLYKKGIEVIVTYPNGDASRIDRKFKKHINIMVQNDNLQPIKPIYENTLKWNGTQTEFIELVKSLIENGNVKGTQTEIISKLSNVFNIEVNNPNKLINDLKLRNIDSETLFLDRLKKSLFDYITFEKKK